MTETACVPATVPGADAAILWIADHVRHDALTPAAIFFSGLGTETFLLALVTLGYWFWRKGAMARVAGILLIAVILNAHLKTLVQECRPAVAPHLEHAGGWSFPSGHAQLSGALWGWLAWEVRQPWFIAVAGAVMLLVAFSRPYLGVHYLHDIGAGLALGLVTVWIGSRVVLWEQGRWRDVHPATQAGIVLAVALLWLAFIDDPENVAWKAAGSLVGLWYGVALDHRHLRFEGGSGWGQKLGMLAVGVAGIVALRVGLKQALAGFGIDHATADFARNMLIGFWIAFGAPWVFVRVGLASRMSPRDEAAEDLAPAEDDEAPAR